MCEGLTLLPLPCPACGGKTALVKRPIYDSGGNSIPTWCVNCERCGLSTGMYPHADIAARKWNALPREFVWKSESPKVPGWYWYRHKPSRTIAMINVDVEPIEYESLPGQWAGPIPEPKEQGRHDE